jgi:hypothetical protein
MKKLLILTAILGGMTILPATSNAATATSNTVAQQEVVTMRSTQPGRRWWNRGVRVVTRTRVVFRNGRRVRETIRVTYRNGRIIRTQVISRVVIGRRYIRNY